jgi:hypothetical protein
MRADFKPVETMEYQVNNKLRLSALAFVLSLAFAASPAAAQTKIGMLS